MSAPRQVVIALLASAFVIVALGACAAEPPSPPLNLEWTYGDGFVDLTWEEPQEDYGTPIRPLPTATTRSRTDGSTSTT
jgi:hypothetical protein